MLLRLKVLKFNKLLIIIIVLTISYTKSCLTEIIVSGSVFLRFIFFMGFSFNY